MLKIDAFMKKEMVTAGAAETVRDVARRMRQKSVGIVLLVEGESLVGLFSERDLLTRVVAEGKDPAVTRVGDVATREVVSVSADASLRRCAEELKAHEVRHLPVVEGTWPVGIISARDFFQVVTGELETLIERARYDEQLREDVDPYDHFGGAYGR
jgi:CBS domain-containing protein